MKTKDNVQKAITKSLAVIISLVLISITVNAQDFWKTVLENSSFSQLAMAMTSEATPASADANSTTDASAFAEYLTEETEESLQLENWMTNENNFFETVNIETEIENRLEIESWMTNESLFNGVAAYFEVETEEALELEDWMKNMDYFGVQTIEFELETEEGLEIETWMTDNSVWKI
ncbi:hypothetical protein OU798_14525 [Prolixibacteraceae bacterium Z1-6]|uniref:Uncharacterized protein n=1 Tax=Draconibacterium aestuarii TaxID=2998507 RepID=A0A9X3FF53_9BACT|nr:hypothetical protein [Prolixibacteraceae bacterium Z1-6]